MRDTLKNLNDLAKAANAFSGMRDHVKTLVKERVDQLVTRMDLVSRAEFERVEAMVQKARERQEELEECLTRLEKQLKIKRNKKK
jgi:BMFP domain-containing protein YqiC